MAKRLQWIFAFLTALGGVVLLAQNPVSISQVGTTPVTTTVPVSGTVAATQSGTWTVQPGNTANSTPWLTTISQGGNSAAVNGSGQLSITCANCSGSGASAVDESAFTQGTNSVAPSGLLFKTAYTALTTGQVGIWRGFSDGSGFVMGSVASGATDSGNPVKVGGIYNSSPITLTNGQRGDVQLDANGYAKVNISAGGSTTVTEAATVTANQASVALTDSVLFAYDGSTDSRLRSRAGLINSADVGLVTRPFLPSDGTNTTPAMDAVARPGFQKVTDGTNTMADPCTFLAKTTDPFSLTARAVVIAAVSAKKNYICAIAVVAGAAEILNIDEGTGTTCQTGTAAIAGSTTAANGLSFAANGGMTIGNGQATVLAGKTVNVDTCLVPSGSNRLSGFITYVQQ